MLEAIRAIWSHGHNRMFGWRNWRRRRLHHLVEQRYIPCKLDQNGRTKEDMSTQFNKSFRGPGDHRTKFAVQVNRERNSCNHVRLPQLGTTFRQNFRGRGAAGHFRGGLASGVGRFDSLQSVPVRFIEIPRLTPSPPSFHSRTLPFKARLRSWLEKEINCIRGGALDEGNTIERSQVTIMSATQELTYSDVSEHTSKKDLYVVIHDKIYNASSFVDEHPYVSPPHIVCLLETLRRLSVSAGRKW